MASVSPMGMTAAMLIVEMAWLRRLGSSPSQIALAITEVAIASSRGVIRRDLVGYCGRHQGLLCARLAARRFRKRQLVRRRPGAELLLRLAAAHPAKPLPCS